MPWLAQHTDTGPVPGHLSLWMLYYSLLQMMPGKDHNWIHSVQSLHWAQLKEVKENTNKCFVCRIQLLAVTLIVRVPSQFLSLKNGFCTKVSHTFAVLQHQLLGKGRHVCSSHFNTHCMIRAFPKLLNCTWDGESTRQTTLGPLI